MRLENRDKPFLIALIVLIWLVGMCAISSLAPPSVPQQQQTAQTNTDKKSLPSAGLFQMPLSKWGADEFTALFTGLLLLVTYGQLRGIQRADTHFQRSERAYIKLSHRPPGVRWNPSKPEHLSVVLEVKNFGSTPGRTIRHCLVAHSYTKAEDLPPHPPYFSIEPMGSFLVANDLVNLHCPIMLDRIDALAAQTGVTKLLISGFVEYEDRFGGIHRSGYARVYSPAADTRSLYASEESWSKRNNLIYDQFPATYNYDRPVSELPKV